MASGKPAAWADEDAPCLAAALMAQRPPCDMQRKRPCKDALLKAVYPEMIRRGRRPVGWQPALADAGSPCFSCAAATTA